MQRYSIILFYSNKFNFSPWLTITNSRASHSKTSSYCYLDLKLYTFVKILNSIS